MAVAAWLPSWRAQLALAAFLAASPTRVACRYMECGPGVPLCGVLTLESGFGPGVYRHEEPVVHGLWPQVNNYGSSKCIRPRRAVVERELYKCYVSAGNRAISFETHEWTTHGMCAGVEDEDDFFDQVCSLADRPLKLMKSVRKLGMHQMDLKLRRNGFPVYQLDRHYGQIELSCCAGHDGRWKLAQVADFPTVCGPGAAPAPAPAPGPAGGEVCVAGRRGPPCHSNWDCYGLAGCARCAHSGFCTNLAETTAVAAAPAGSEEEVPVAAPAPALLLSALAGFVAIAMIGIFAFAISTAQARPHEQYMSIE